MNWSWTRLIEQAQQRSPAVFEELMQVYQLFGTLQSAYHAGFNRWCKWALEEIMM